MRCLVKYKFIRWCIDVSDIVSVNLVGVSLGLVEKCLATRSMVLYLDSN